jgi:hypothetical protein
VPGIVAKLPVRSVLRSDVRENQRPEEFRETT